jgi:hypothetical protein
MAGLIDRFGSAWVEVRIEAPVNGDGFLWKRTPGPLGPSHFPVVWCGDSHVADGVELVWPDIENETLTYRVGGPSSAAKWLRRPEAEFRRRALDTVGRCIDVVMQVCRVNGSTPSLNSPPAPLRRLSAHLGNPATASAVLRWRAALKESVDRSAVDGLLDLLASHHDDDPAFAHGGLSIGGIVPVTTGAYDCVLTGEDSGGASAGHDIGWLVGELLELRATAYDAADEHLVGLLDEVIRDVLREHGGHPEGIHRAAVLRIALHAEDYAHFIGWDDQLIRRAQLLEKVWSDDAWASTGCPPAF